MDNNQTLDSGAAGVQDGGTRPDPIAATQVSDMYCGNGRFDVISYNKRSSSSGSSPTSFAGDLKVV